MKCQDFRELIDSYLSDELLTETNHEVLHHLEQCAGCRGVIEERRRFRAKLRSAVQNCEELKICEKYKANLQNLLKQSVSQEKPSKSPFLPGGYFPIAAAAGLLVFTIFGFWFSQNPGEDAAPGIVASNQHNSSIHLQKAALGDHRNCAVKYQLAEAPVEIDLSSPQYADLREGVLIPLKNELGRCELVESHKCKYDGHIFTHLVFDYEGKTLSVLMTDLDNHKSLKDDYIARLSEQGYQLAHFDVNDKAVFVVSDLTERKNSIAAEILKAPMRRRFADKRQAASVSFADYRY